MQTFIGAKLLSSQIAQPGKKPFEIYDSRLAGFILRVAHKELLPALDTTRERVSAREVIGFGGSVRRTQL